MKKLTLLLIATLALFSVSAQGTVKLTVSGQGATKEVATANALRSAIEQAFGTFVSANTQILNDEIVKEEIATISSGNIQEYKELSCITMPDGSKSVSLSATVSIGNLISYAKSKGSSAEFAGAVFAMNMKMRKLNAENETTALYNMLDQLYSLSLSVFDWELEVGEPTVLPDQKYKIPMIAKAKINGNTAPFFSLLFNTLESLSLSPSEVEGYKANKMEVYTIKAIGRDFTLRNDYRNFITYLTYLINCIGESFHIYGQIGDQKTKMLYDLSNKTPYATEISSGFLLASMERTYTRDPYTLMIKNLDAFMNNAPGSVAFKRELSVSVDEKTLYQLHGFEVVPAPNISRLTFVRKNGMMVVDTMNVYQSVDFEPEGFYDFEKTIRDAFRYMRVLYVSEDCLAEYDDISFYNQDCLQKITVERCGVRNYHSRGYLFINGCDNLETVRIGKGMKFIGDNAFQNNPKLSSVIIGSTLTYGEDVIDLTALTEEDLQDIIIFGDEVKSIGSGNRFGNPAESKNSLSVVFNRDIRCNYDIGSFNLILVPKDCLSYFKKNRYYDNPEPIEDKMSELGCVDLLSLLKRLCQSDFRK